MKNSAIPSLFGACFCYLTFRLIVLRLFQVDSFFISCRFSMSIRNVRKPILTIEFPKKVSKRQTSFMVLVEDTFLYKNSHKLFRKNGFLVWIIFKVFLQNFVYCLYSSISFHIYPSLFVLLFLRFPLPQRSTEVSSVELYAVLVEDAEDGAAAVEAADGPDVVDGVAAVVH